MILQVVGNHPGSLCFFWRVFFPLVKKKRFLLHPKIRSPEVGLFTGYAPAMSIFEGKNYGLTGGDVCGRKIFFFEGKKVDVNAI